MGFEESYGHLSVRGTSEADALHALDELTGEANMIVKERGTN